MRLSVTSEAWQRYYEQRKDLDHSAFEIGDRYDKLALAVSGGGFILSVTFLEKVASSPPTWVRWFLIAAWVLFGVSIVAQLIALRFSQQAQQHNIQDLDLSYVHERDGTQRTDFSAADKARLASQHTTWANVWSLWTTIAGLSSISLFGACAIMCKSPDDKSNYEKQHTTAPAENTRGHPGLCSAGQARIPEPTKTAITEDRHMSDDDDKKMRKITEAKGTYVPPPNAIKPPAETKATPPSEPAQPSSPVPPASP